MLFFVVLFTSFFYRAVWVSVFKSGSKVVNIFLCLTFLVTEFVGAWQQLVPTAHLCVGGCSERKYKHLPVCVSFRYHGHRDVGGHGLHGFPWILKRFFSFEWEKINFTTFGTP